MRHWPALALITFTPFFAELLSTNLGLARLFNPVVFLILATVAYGFPVLLIRETVARFQLSTAGTFCLGLAYGIYNEGPIAKTVLLSRGLPIPSFDHQGVAGGIAWAWTAYMSAWHALYSVIIPLALVSALFPGEGPWLGRKTTLALLVPVLLGAAAFFTPDRALHRPAGTPLQFVLLGAVVLPLLALAFLLPRGRPATAPARRRIAVLAAPLCAFAVFSPLLLSALRVPLPVFFAFLLVVVVGAAWRLDRLSGPDLAVASLGGVFAMASLTFLTRVSRGPTEFLVTSAGFMLLATTGTWALIRRR